MLKEHAQYAAYVARHKWHVFIESVKLCVPIRGLLHDLSKFSPDEWFPYVKYFYGKKTSGTTGYNHKPGSDSAFDKAWLLHQKRNPHHWQFWVLHEDDGSELKRAAEALLLDATQDELETAGCHGDYDWIRRERVDDLKKAASSGGVKVLEMPMRYRKEMLADWKGAGKAQGYKAPDDCANWYRKNRNNMILGPQTRFWVERQLGVRP